VRKRRRSPAPEEPAVRRASVSPDDVVRQNERSRGGLLLEEDTLVRKSQVDLNESLVPQIRALLGKS
jgi:hypothetical protein